MNVQEILSQVITRTNEIFEAEAGSVTLVNAGRGEMVIRAAVGAGADAVRGLSVPADKSIIGWVITQEKPALVPDVSRDARFYEAADASSGFKTHSIMCVPLKTDGRTIGAIELMNMRPGYLSENGLQILSVIADHAALAIENARLLAESRQRAEEQALLFDAMTFVTSDLALETVLDAVSRQIVEGLKADLCIISRWDREGERLCPMQAYAGPGIKRPDKLERPLADYERHRTILETQSFGLLQLNTPTITAQERKWLATLNIRSLLLVPLIYRRQTVGLVEIGRVSTSAPLTPGESRLAEIMTAQAAVAIEHARLYNEATRRLAEARVLQEVMVAAASSLDFDQVLTGTIDALHRTLGIERLGFFLPSIDGKSVAPHPATVGFSFRERTFHYPVEGSAAGWVIRHGKPLLLPSEHALRDYYELSADTRAKMCVPVIVKEQVAAVLNAESPRPNAFDEDDLRLFNAIAAELAVALENARLFEEIRAAEANYHDLFDNANDLIVTMDSNFRIGSANKAALKTSGYSLEELHGAPVIRFIPPAKLPQLYKLLKERLNSERSPTFETSFLTVEQREVLLEVTLRVQRRGRRPVGIHCIARDITERRQLERQLQQTEKLSAMGKLVAGVAHELNNPLTAILGYTELLHEKKTLCEDGRSDLAVISRQAERARLIVRNLLTFARRVHLQKDTVDVNEVIQASLKATKPHLGAQGVHVMISLDSALPLTMADPYQLEQVFINLTTNAIHALATVEGKRKLAIESRQQGDHIIVIFADNGPGIPAGVISRIFDPFFSTKTVGEGTGLGLSICFGIISEHRGRIWAENGSKGGARFYVELPVEAPLPVRQAGEDGYAALASASEPLTILVVDDEPSLLKLMSRILEPLGHTVDTAPDGTTALERLQNNAYDLVICDILMPDILGPDLYRQVLESLPEVKSRFIFVTGNVVDVDTRSFLENSGVPWLSKPFLPVDVKKLVRKVMAPD